MKAKQTKTTSRLKKVLYHFHMAVMPHRANHYRPHLVRRHGLVSILLIIIAVQVGYDFSIRGSVLGEEAPITSEALLDNTNRERAKYQLQPLEFNEKLSRAAEMKAQDMLQKQYWAHTAPDGVTPWKWFEEVGYGYAAAGENLAKNFQTADAVLSAWMASLEHRKNVLGSYHDVGFATATGMLEGKETQLVVALYGTQTIVVGGGQITSAPISGPLGNLGIAVQTLPPDVLGAMIILLATAAVALLAHVYREKLPKGLRRSWYRHHGIIKAGGLLGICLIVLLLQTQGQI